jgi:LDH2 family malate/lactate/ureidoglycolate dehydrogenase
MVIDSEAAKRFCVELLSAYHVREEDAEIVADNLVEAELRGIRSHGLYQLKYYTYLLKSGKMNTRPNITIVRDGGSVVTVDADRAPGAVAGKRAMKICIERAKTSGIAGVTVENATHFGIAAYYAMMALEENMIGIALCNAPPSVLAYGGIARQLGTNPICVAVPAGRSLPVVYDGATSEAAIGKISIALAEGKPIPKGWAIDRNGNDTTNAEAVADGALLPFGGYKGFGLSLIVHIMSGLLSGASFRKEDDGSVTEQTDGVGFYFGAIDIRKFVEVSDFTAAVDRMVERMKASAQLPDAPMIVMPGEQEFLNKEKYLREGIAIGPGVWRELTVLKEASL